MATYRSEALPGLLDELIDGWQEFVNGDGSNLSDWKGRTQEQVATIMSLTAHVHATAMQIRPVMPHDLSIVQMPLVRSIFESTITVAWCDEVADAAYGLLNEGARQRRALRDSLHGTRTMSHFAETISGTDWTDLPTSSGQPAKYIKQRCDDVALDGAYAFYRMLSSLSHVSIDTIDAYLDADSVVEGRPLSVKSRPDALPSSVAWSHLVASCLVWSGMVVNYLDKERQRRNSLRRIARQLDIKPELAVKYDAHLRGRRAARST